MSDTSSHDNSTAARPLAARQVRREWTVTKWRFALVGLLLIVPFGVLSLLQYSTASEQLEFNADEERGLNYIAAVREVLRSVELHAIASASGSPAREESNDGSIAAIDSGVARVDELKHSSNPEAVVRVKEDWAHIRIAWQSLKPIAGSETSESIRKQDELISRITEHIVLAGTTSNLILDPEVDSYWLAEMYVTSLPRFTHNLTTALALHALRHPTQPAAVQMSALELQAWDVLNTLEQVNLHQAAVANFRKTGTTDLEHSLKPEFTRLRATTAAALDNVRTNDLASVGPSNLSVALPMIRDAIESAFAFHRQITPELMKIIERRQTRYARERLWGTASSILGALLFTGLLAWVFASTRRAIVVIRDSSERNEALALQLQNRNEQLEAERQLRERFVSILAHDLRAPLAVVKLAVQQLTHKSVDPNEATLAMARIQRGIDRTEGMIRDLLDANRIRAGEKLPIRLAELDMVSLVNDVASELTVAHSGRILVRGETSVVGCWSGEEVRRAIWNLVSNGLKYGSPNTPVIVEVTKKAATVEIAVHNEGPELSAEDRSKIFDPFRRTIAADRSTTQGWGLGLTLVRGCAEAHGGHVRIESSSEGTTFAMELPIDPRIGDAAPLLSPPPERLEVN